MKPQSKIGVRIVMGCLALLLSTASARAFALLGPFESWMEETNGLRQQASFTLGGGQTLPEDIGGPMDISNEYRWNVPVVTYGFDQSFLDFFGTNGVAAVENAIQILNNLPPASQIVLTNFSLDSTHVNYEAQSLSLYDLKSETLSLLLEQMGLTQPTRYIFMLNGWNPSLFFYQPQYGSFSENVELPNPFTDPGDNIINFLVERNFDPETLTWSPYVNGTLYGGEVYSWLAGSGYGGFPGQQLIIPYAVDPFADTYTAVTDFPQGAGEFYSGLTEDDVGGLAYLLSTNNVNFETLLPGVYGVGTNADAFVNCAWRLGIDKITFVPQPVDSLTGLFLSVTNQFTDTYITNGNIMQQQLARVVSQPDFLFCAKNLGFSSPEMSRTGTTNWINNATLNGNPDGAGPGMIQPPVVINFNKSGNTFVNGNPNPDESVYDYTSLWGTFDGSTNAPVIYSGLLSGTNQITVSMWLEMGRYPKLTMTRFDWKPTSAAGAAFTMDTSTNLTDWITLFTVMNNGSICTYYNFNPASPSRFYRLVPQ